MQRSVHAAVAEGDAFAGEDTDGHGLLDSVESASGLDPLVSDGQADKDGDRISSAEEIERGTDPIEEDTDRSGTVDSLELLHGLDPRGSVGGRDDVRDCAMGDLAASVHPTSARDLVTLARLVLGRPPVATLTQRVIGDVAPWALDARGAEQRVGDAVLDDTDLRPLRDTAMGRLALEGPRAGGSGAVA